MSLGVSINSTTARRVREEMAALEGLAGLGREQYAERARERLAGGDGARAAHGASEGRERGLGRRRAARATSGALGKVSAACGRRRSLRALQRPKGWMEGGDRGRRYTARAADTT